MPLVVVVAAAAAPSRPSPRVPVPPIPAKSCDCLLGLRPELRVEYAVEDNVDGAVEDHEEVAEGAQNQRPNWEGAKKRAEQLSLNRSS